MFFHVEFDTTFCWLELSVAPYPVCDSVATAATAAPAASDFKK